MESEGGVLAEVEVEMEREGKGREKVFWLRWRGKGRGWMNRCMVGEGRERERCCILLRWREEEKLMHTEGGEGNST